MVHRHDGPDDHDHEEPEFGFDDVPAPDEPDDADDATRQHDGFQYSGPSAYDIALSERDEPTDDPGVGIRWLKSAGAVLLILAALGLLMSLVGPLAFSRDNDTVNSVFSSVRVNQVLDGNTIVVTLDEELETVRYIGVSVGVPGESFFRTSQLANQSWVEGEIVIMERDGDDRDDEGRLLRYVYVNNQMVNAALLATGLARYRPDPSNRRYNTELLASENAARSAERGIWAGDDTPRASPA